MSRYYFNVQQGAELLKDPVGDDLDDPEELRRKALESARELVAEGAREGQNWLAWSVIVTDAGGEPVLTLPLSEAVQ